MDLSFCQTAGGLRNETVGYLQTYVWMTPLFGGIGKGRREIVACNVAC